MSLVHKKEGKGGEGPNISAVTNVIGQLVWPDMGLMHYLPTQNVTINMPQSQTLFNISFLYFYLHMNSFV